jgi:Flp pilus assembly protein TadD
MSLGVEMSRLCLWLSVTLLAVELAACGTVNSAPPPPGEEAMASAPAEAPSEEAKYVPSSEPLRLGLRHFNRGDYGLAERYFRDAVEKAPKDAAAWIGLAASYDHVGRFDLADRAYRTATKLAGETTEILNNQGYSFMLRGNLSAARAKLRRAYLRDPDNPTIANNLRILDSHNRSARREH